MAAKKTSELIPFCHQIPVSNCNISIEADTELPTSLRINCYVKAYYHTGVEMEALIGATHAALCIYDMTKALGHDIEILSTKLVSKTGGKQDFKNE